MVMRHMAWALAAAFGSAAWAALAGGPAWGAALLWLLAGNAAFLLSAAWGLGAERLGPWAEAQARRAGGLRAAGAARARA